MNDHTLEVVVRERREEGGVAVLTLADPLERPLPPFTAGAHLDLHLPGGLARPYSLCSDPRDRSAYRLGVLRDPDSRGGSVLVHQLLTPGARVAIGAPRNHFPLAEGAPHSVLVGGGIGITPMLAMAWSLHTAGASFELHYCARSRAQAAFLGELAAVPWTGRVTLHFDDGGETARLAPRALLQAAPAGVHVYVCGPSGFMDWVMAEAASAGLAPAQVHKEYFAAPAATAATSAAGADAPFEVLARRCGKAVRVEAGQTLLSALASAGIRIPVSCEQGVCGTCACTVLEGEPDHRDAYLSEEERAANDQILVCCSRARSPRLVLDL